MNVVLRQETQDPDPVETDQENPKKTATPKSIEHKVSQLSEWCEQDRVVPIIKVTTLKEVSSDYAVFNSWPMVIFFSLCCLKDILCGFGTKLIVIRIT